MKREELDRQLKNMKPSYQKTSMNIERGWLNLSAKIMEVSQEPLTVRERALETPNRNMIMRFAPAMMILVLVFGSGVTAVSASQNSLPGDLLYPLTRAIENVQYSTATNQKNKAVLKVKHAEKRLSEIKKMKVLSKVGLASAPKVQNSDDYENAVLDAVDNYQELLSSDEAGNVPELIKDLDNRLHSLQSESVDVEEIE